MKAKAPRGLRFLSAVYVGIALSLPIQLIWIYNLNWNNSYWGLTHMSLGNCLVALFSLATAYALFRSSPKAQILLPATATLILVNNWWVSHIDTTFSALQTGVASGLYLLAHAALLHPHSLQALKKSAPKPWNREPRAQKCYVTTVLPPLGPAMVLKSFDISRSGIFLSTEEIGTPRGQMEQPSLDQLRVGSEVTLRVQVNHLRIVRVTAKVVRKLDRPEGTYPPGVGLHFVSLDREAKKHLSSALS
jgi:hypothetical protein